MDSEWNASMDAVVSFSHLLATVNSSLNFLIYCYKDEKFRLVFMSLMFHPFNRNQQSIVIV
jgi:hypothetical protein